MPLYCLLSNQISYGIIPSALARFGIRASKWAAPTNPRRPAPPSIKWRNYYYNLRRNHEEMMERESERERERARNHRRVFESFRRGARDSDLRNQDKVSFAKYLDSIWIGSFKLRVFVARVLKGSMVRKSVPVTSTVRNSVPPNQSSLWSSMSYKDVLKSSSSSKVPSAKHKENSLKLFHVPWNLLRPLRNLVFLGEASSFAPIVEGKIYEYLNIKISGSHHVVLVSEVLDFDDQPAKISSCYDSDETLSGDEEDSEIPSLFSHDQFNVDKETKVVGSGHFFNNINDVKGGLPNSILHGQLNFNKDFSGSKVDLAVRLEKNLDLLKNGGPAPGPSIPFSGHSDVGPRSGHQEERNKGTISMHKLKILVRQKGSKKKSISKIGDFSKSNSNSISRGSKLISCFDGKMKKRKTSSSNQSVEEDIRLHELGSHIGFIWNDNDADEVKSQRQPQGQDIIQQ
ncbi:hypothetical protein L6452_32496 [Arctium lappa]|uniref:Uncharacterized protein n=1 Tax=Arctium lappa TaxID=4217 RepID=A0ACB8Z4N8_ARCLA|nr:hypothetical protein L6452_32496 [Arctium lappa]